MNTTTIPVEETPPEAPENTPPPTIKERLNEAWARLESRQKILLMVAIAAILALIVAASLMFKQPDYRILFSNLSERDGGAIISSLEAMNIPYKFTDSGGAIMIPTAKVHEVRLRLATQGLPKGGSVGFELMENQKFGISQFAEQVNYQRGLEGELARTIQSISAVQTARIHLAIPRPTVFVREDLKPSASVLLNMYPGRSLDPSQIAGIQNLVAASVPNLLPANISLVDQNGVWISRPKETSELNLTETQMKYVQDTETTVVKRIDDILSKIVGAGNARAQVAVEMDFSQSEQTEESYGPGSTRSEQRTESVNGNPTPAMGVPGALTNQPPVPPTAPLTQPAVPATGAGVNPNAPPVPGQLNVGGVQAPVGSVGSPISTQKNSTTNYEVNRTIRHTKGSVGSIKRLTAAVAINYRKDNSKAGSKPLTDDEIKNITELVKNAMGYSKERGDTVSVVNTSFSPEEAKESSAIWKDPDMRNVGWDIAKLLIILGIITYIIFGVVRPLVRMMMPPPPIEEEDDEEDDEVQFDENGVELPPKHEFELHKSEAVLTLEKMIEDARSLSMSDPQIVANIIKDWTGTNAH